MKIAVCVSGYPRTWRHCVQSQLDFFGPGTDYFLHTWRNGADVLAPTDWTFDELNSAYRPMGIFTEDRPDYSDFESKIVSTFDPQYSSANLIYIAHGIYESHRLCKQYARNNLISYDIVFRIRYDCLFNGRLNVDKLQPSKLNLPYQSNYHGGYNDQVCCGSLNVMSIFSNLLLNIDKTLRYPPHKFKHALTYIGEVVLKHWCDTQGLGIHKAPIEYRILRPKHIGLEFNDIPENDHETASLRNGERLCRAREILGFTS